MKLKPALVAASLLLAVSAASATTSFDVGGATLTYDETTSLGFTNESFNSFQSEGFNWKIPVNVTLTNIAQNTIALKYVALPSFTIQAKPGYALSDLTGFFGNPTFFDFGGTSNIAFTGNVSINGAAPVHIQDALIGFEITGPNPPVSNLNTGYFSQTYTVPGAFSSFSVSEATLLLSAAVDANGTVASITSTPQNKLEISYTVVAVPEPETTAMLLAGLVAMGWMTQRRRNT